MDFRRYIGVMHVHTTFSDGSGGVEEIVTAARRAGLDFVIITDHNDLRAKVYEGWHDGVLVLVGEEVTRPGGNHMLALGVKELIPPEVSAQEGIDRAKAQGGLAFLAHPFYRGSPIIEDPPLPWWDWNVVGFDGIEIWNLTADLYQLLGQQGLDKPLGDLLRYAFPNREAIRKWDELLSYRRTVGVGGLDAHAERVARWGGEVVLPYEKVFSSLRVHLFLREPLIGNFEHDSHLVYRALGRGHFAITFDWLLDARNYLVVGQDGMKSFLPGDEMPDEGVIQGQLPSEALTKIVLNGLEVKHERGSFSFKASGNGALRLEVFLDNRPWIIFNPFYLESKRRTARTEREVSP